MTEVYGLDRSGLLGRGYTIDHLTGLLAPRIFYPAVVDWLSRALDRPCTIVAVDVDRMKMVNDYNGLPAGDMLLVHIASVMQECLPHPALLFRTGGDEFGAILPDTTCDVASERAEVLRRAIAAYSFRLYPPEQDASGVGSVTATCSIALSTYPQDLPLYVAAYAVPEAATPEEAALRVLRLCDNSMHAAKNDGGNVTRAASMIRHW